MTDHIHFGTIYSVFILVVVFMIKFTMINLIIFVITPCSAVCTCGLCVSVCFSCVL